MPLFIDQKYVNLISIRLKRFQRKSEFLWNCRCPICLDSKTNENKARGYIYRKKDDLFYRCHNCSVGMSLGNLIKHMDPTTYNEYVAETYMHKHGGVKTTNETTNYKGNRSPNINIKAKSEGTGILFGCDKIADLPKDHWAVRYILGRKIPANFLAEICFCPNFKDTVQHMVPGKDVEKMPDGEPRIIIPFRSTDNILIGFQGRSLAAETPRDFKYMTIKLDEGNPKIWGLHRVDLSKRVYVLEGPFDAMFLQNALATTDSSLYNIRRTLPDLDNCVLIPDNTPRNPEIVAGIKKSIDMGFDVCLWPNTLDGLKDVNDMILAGHSAAEIQHIVDHHTYSGLQAQLELAKWKR